MLNCEIEPEKQVCEKSVSTQIREVYLKQKQKTKTKIRKSRGPRPAAPFHGPGDAAVHGGVFTGRSQSEGRAKARDAPRGQPGHFLVPKKLATSTECFTLPRMPNVPAAESV